MEEGIKVYSTPTCPYCKAAKAFLDGKGVQYEDIDVSRDHEAAKKMVEASGQMGVPQIFIAGKIVVGFDEESLAKEIESMQ